MHEAFDVKLKISLKEKAKIAFLEAIRRLIKAAVKVRCAAKHYDDEGILDEWDENRVRLYDAGFCLCRWRDELREEEQDEVTRAQLCIVETLIGTLGRAVRIFQNNGFGNMPAIERAYQVLADEDFIAAFKVQAPHGFDGDYNMKLFCNIMGVLKNPPKQTGVAGFFGNIGNRKLGNHFFNKNVESYIGNPYLDKEGTPSTDTELTQLLTLKLRKYLGQIL